MDHELGLIVLALAGALAGAVLALLPGLHIYNVAGLVFLAVTHRPELLSGQAIAMLMIGMVVGWSVVNVIPAVFLFAPDDASAFVVLPATKMLLRGRGLDATMLVGAGSLGALLTLTIAAPVLDEVLRPVRQIIAPHIGWMLVAIIAFLVIGEWPRHDALAPTPLRRLLSAWAYLGAGLITFLLSGVLGFVLLYRSPVPIDASFQNLLPAFVGLFAVPGLLQILFFGVRPPRQETALRLDVTPYQLARGTLTGVAGGLFAGVLPVISGGIGGLLAGHATAQRDDRLFLVSQGASKIAYYIGGLLLLFVPGVGLTRGGMAWMLSTTYVPYGWRTYWLAVTSVALAGALSFTLLVLIGRAVGSLSGRFDPKLLAGAALLISIAITVGFTGLGGLGVMIVATLIGLIPVLVGGRRMNCLGVLLLPITLNVVGIGPDIARALGLL
ncbi:MAG: tripartite tricarboxylate transporter permease [Anaerolineae bacterium]|nr:tripartite tricarboxylate transporter permease [Thermoflexales bacterium]MDW8408216.1 tripartite tricarboxylate transporter permease [Anaerolineae bacterium]